jgi:hypothetical protein
LAKRNAVRREAKLPLLNLRAEFDREVEVAAWRDARVKHADDMARIEHDVLVELRARRGADFPQSAVGQWLVRFELNVSSQCWRNVVFIHPHRDIR